MSAYEFDDHSVRGVPMDFERLFGPLKKLLIGWEHIDAPFDADELDAMISVAEAYEIVNKLVLAAPSASEKNDCGSPSR